MSSALSTKPPNPERGRPLDDSLTKAILQETLTQIAERGYRPFRVSDVAEQVGTSKQALYRRWPSKAVLAAAAVAHALEQGNPAPPNSSSLRADLLQAMENTRRQLMESPLGKAIRALLAEPHDEALRHSLQEAEGERRGLMRAILVQAQERGELEGERDLELDIDLLLGTFYFKFLLRQQPIAAETVPQVVDLWLATAQQQMDQQP